MRIGACSWSLRPEGPEDLAQKVLACGLDAVQLALDPIRTGAWDERKTHLELRRAGITVLSGMIATRGEDYSTLDSIRRTGGLRPDEHWDENLAAIEACAAIARRLGLRLVTMHAGFLPHEPDDPLRGVMLGRLRLVSEVVAAGGGLVLGLETGQETAETLERVIGDLASPVAVNFDPANMILYGMGEPVAALRRLARWVQQVHVKDAVPAERPGKWGTEVRAGTGAVDWAAFFGVLGRHCPDANLLIEREARTGTLDDIIAAAELVRRYASA